MNETPYCFCLLMAEFVKRERGSGTFTLVGVFDSLTFSALPIEMTIAVFFGVIDGRGRMPIKLQVVDSDEEANDEPVAALDAEIELSNPLEQFETQVPIPVRFERPGVYHLELWANGERIQTRRLTIIEASREA